MTKIEAGTVEEVDAGVCLVEVEGQEIGVFRRRGEYFAVRNRCPHLGAPLCSGLVRDHLTHDDAVPWTPVVDSDRPVIVCPWHRWEFDARTGQALVGRERIKMYPVEVVDGRVVVDVPTRTT